MKFVKTAVAMLLVLALFALAGCASDDDGIAGDSPLGTDPSYIPSNNEDEPALLRPARDLEGRQILLACWWIWFEEHSFEAPDPATSRSYQTERLWYDNMRRIEQEYNVSLDNLLMEAGAMLPALTTQVMAGELDADVWMLDPAWVLPAIMGNLIHPVSHYAPADSDALGAQRFVRAESTFQGESWNFNRAEYHAQGMGLGVNQDIIAAIGAPNPVDLFNRGEWTWEAMREIMLLATRDTDGDGVVDQFGLSGQPGDFLRTAIAANGGLMVDPDTLTPNFGSPDALYALNFAHNLMINDGVWSYDINVPTLDWGRNFGIYVEGNSAFFTIAHWRVFYDRDGMAFTYSMVPFPEGPSSRGYVGSTGFDQGLAIPVGVRSPEDVFVVMEQVLSWPGEHYYLINDGLLEYVRAGWQTEEDVWRILHDIGENTVVDLGAVIPGFAGMLNSFFGSWFDEGMTVMQTVETFDPVLQDMIDTALGAMAN